MWICFVYEDMELFNFLYLIDTRFWTNLDFGGRGGGGEGVCLGGREGGRATREGREGVRVESDSQSRRLREQANKKVIKVVAGGLPILQTPNLKTVAEIYPIACMIAR